ncbi:MAG: hypothetical protein WBJ36_04870 [Tenuifilum sp.]|uniref:hypothetical protein n=1 Tax=Tenuifilum sp. TaxID=2760880 RepID=UPI003C9C2192
MKSKVIERIAAKILIEKYQLLENFYPDLLSGITDIIQKGKIASRFPYIEMKEDEISILIKAKELSELKIIELWNNQDTEEFRALCSIYFDIATLLDKDFEFKNEEEIYELIKIISFGYLGEHNHFVKNYLISKKELIENISVPEQWNSRLLVTIFKGIVCLVAKHSWKDIDNAVILINQLRKEQKDFESKFLNTVNEDSRPYGSAELVSLYHFAKTVEILGQYLLEGRVNGNEFDIENKIKYHLSVAKEFANASANIVLEMLYKYFEAFSIKLINIKTMENKVTPNQIIELINSLPDSEKHIFIENGKYWVTQEWLCGAFAGRAFVNEILEDAVQEMIDYLYKHIGHDSMVGNSVTKSGFPNLERVKQYCTPVESEQD